MYDLMQPYIEYLIDLFYELDYLFWLWCVAIAVIIAFALPCNFFSFMYVSNIFCVIHNWLYRKQYDTGEELRYAARRAILSTLYAFGRFWYGFEVEGMERIPEKGPALVVFYHGQVPVDIQLFSATLLRERKRTLHMVIERFFFRMPGLRLLLKTFQMTTGSVEALIDVLNNGHVIGIAPGGLRETMFSDENYGLIWNKRSGFARVALQANVPVFPVFTQNIREAFRAPLIFRYLLRGLYESTRQLIMPSYGGFPVKLRAIVGDAVQPDDGSTPEEYARKIEKSLELLIAKHQRLPGSIVQALLDRLT